MDELTHEVQARFEQLIAQGQPRNTAAASAILHVAQQHGVPVNSVAVNATPAQIATHDATAAGIADQAMNTASTSIVNDSNISTPTTSLAQHETTLAQTSAIPSASTSSSSAEAVTSSMASSSAEEASSAFSQRNMQSALSLFLRNRMAQDIANSGSGPTELVAPFNLTNIFGAAGLTAGNSTRDTSNDSSSQGASKRSRQGSNAEADKRIREKEPYNFVEKFETSDSRFDPAKSMTVDAIRELATECKSSGDFVPLVRLVGSTFNSPQILMHSFLREDVRAKLDIPTEPSNDSINSSHEDSASNTSETEMNSSTPTAATETEPRSTNDEASAVDSDVSMTEESPEKNSNSSNDGTNENSSGSHDQIDESDPSKQTMKSPRSRAPANPGFYYTSTNDSGLDIQGLVKMYEELDEIEDLGLHNAFLNAFTTLCSRFEAWVAQSGISDTELSGRPFHCSVHLRALIIVALCPKCMDPDFHRPVLFPMYKIAPKLDRRALWVLGRWFTALENTDTFKFVVQSAQQYITLRLYGSTATLRDIFPAVYWLSILHHANEKSYASTGKRKIPAEIFYNDVISNEVNLQNDFERWIVARRNRQNNRRNNNASQFSFCAFPFILDAAAKSTILSLDAQHQMAQHYRQSLLIHYLSRSPATHPYFILRIRRDNLLEDALTGITRAQPKTELKKPLRVKFEGEEGLDEGGVRKEFFQLVTRQLFSPEFGMFTEEQDTKFLWFNPDAYLTGVSRIQYELIGSLIGLAIYNSVILEVNFPLVLYRKLKNVKPTLKDLEEFRPEVGRSMRQLLDYDGGDDEDIFGLTFTVAYENVWGEKQIIDLIENGSNISVNAENKRRYVQRYVDWLLGEQIDDMFRSFKTGFLNVAGGDALDIFRAEELQLLVIGSQELNFEALEKSTRYEEPYSADHRVIKDLWSVTHSLSADEKRKFLSFCTGSDRAPIKGLGSLRLVVSRAGPDSDQLPTAHTCFNHLLVPEYSSKEKLETKLRAAIRESEGFGLI